ncbi:MAG: hypothetical protein ACYSUD_08400 [Planctomycetota bacterium]
MDLKKHEEEIALRREELHLRRAEKKFTLNSPVGIAVIAAAATLVGTLLTSYQGRTNSRLERQRFQSELILKALEMSPDAKSASQTVQFFFDAGFIDDDGSLSKLWEEAENLEVQEPLVSVSPIPYAYLVEQAKNDNLLKLNVSDFVEIYGEFKEPPKANFDAGGRLLPEGDIITSKRKALEKHFVVRIAADDTAAINELISLLAKHDVEFERSTR